MNTGIIILAAGESTRMGEPKQLLPYRGTTLLQHAIDTARSVPRAPVVVVLGANADRIRGELNEPFILIEENPDWREGMGSSIRTGLGALTAAYPKVSSAIFLLCDQPLVSASTLTDLIAAHERTKRGIVASEYCGALGVPALFARSVFPELMALDGADGARQVIHAHRAEAIGIHFEDGVIDLDTPEDYTRFNNSLVERLARIPA